MASLAVKYRPKTWDEVVEQTVTTEILRSLCESGELQNRNFLLTGPAGTGKAQPLYSNVLTPDGFIQMRDVKVGTLVYTHTGAVAKVSGVYPQGMRDIYTVKLDDGCSFVVADNHLHLVDIDYTGFFGLKKEHGRKVLNTTQLIHRLRHSANICIPNTPEVGRQITDELHGVRPYVAGLVYAGVAMLNDEMVLRVPKDTLEDKVKLSRIVAALAAALEVHDVQLECVHTHDVWAYCEVRTPRATWVMFDGEVQSAAQTLRMLQNMGYDIPRTTFRSYLNGRGGQSIKEKYSDLLASHPFKRVSPLVYICQHVGITSGDIVELPDDLSELPHEYFTCSPYSRAELLAGIIAASEVSTPGDGKLLLEFGDRSPQLRDDVASLIRSRGGWAQVFGTRVLCAVPGSPTLPPRKIISIEPCGRDVCQCIMVDHPDHTYITDGYCVTHNTTTGRIMADVLNDGKGTPIEIDAASHNGVDSVRELVQQAMSYPIGCKYKTFICDECFEGATLVSTPDGDIRIDEIQEGDMVYTLSGVAPVRKVFKTAVPMHRLMLVVTPKEEILTTQDHLFMTANGWVKAINLRKGDHLLPQPLVERAICSSTIAFPDEFAPSVVYKYQQNLQWPLFRSEPATTSSAEDPRAGWCYTDCEPMAVEQCVHDCQFGQRQHDVLGLFPYASAYGRVRIDSITQSVRRFGRVPMYDLEVAGHPSYFANGYLVHNCHAFSNQAWQVLLKVLEEGPAKSVFIFATTNPEKIPATIISRVQRFPLSKISLDGINRRLHYVVEQENNEGAGITYTEDALNYLAKLANGGMRDALTMLETTLTYSKSITSQSLMESLSLPNYDTYFQLLQAYAKKDNAAIAQIVDDVYNSGVNFVKWFEQFHSFVVNVVKYILLQDINRTMIPSHYQDKISKYGPAHSTICLKLANRLVQLNAELKTTSYLQEFALTYLCSVPKKGA